jgi:hypothetical protein
MLAIVLTSGLLSRPTSAESLFYKTTCGLFGLLGVQCKTAPATQPTVAPGSGSSKPSDTAGSSNAAATPPVSTNQSSAKPPASPSFAPVSMPDQSLPTITPIGAKTNTGSTMLQSGDGRSLSNTIGNTETDSAVLGTMDKTPLRSSVAGWMIFGTAWYWWVAIIGVLFVGWKLLKKFVITRVAEHS